MFTELLSLETRIGQSLIRPFYFAGLALAVLLTGIGVLTGFALFATSVPVGLVVVLFGLVLGGVTVLGVRIMVEAVTAVVAISDRIAAAAAAPRPTVSRTA